MECTKVNHLGLECLEGITPSLLNTLSEIGINTIEALAFSTVKELETAGIPNDKAKLLIQRARQLVIPKTFITAKELMELRRNIKFLTTGAKALDKLIGGGYETQSITEFFGQYGSGKSQSVLTACITAQMPLEEGGLDGGVLFIDTEETFSPKRVMQIAEARGLDPIKALDRIVVAEAYNVEHQMFLVDRADKIIKENDIKLIVVDSLTAHFRSEFLGRETLAERQQKLNMHMHKLLKLARIFNLAVIVTNQVYSKPDQSYASYEWDAVGGNVVGHTSTLRLRIRKASANKRIVTLVDSSWLPFGECAICITEKGIADVEES